MINAVDGRADIILKITSIFNSGTFGHWPTTDESILIALKKIIEVRHNNLDNFKAYHINKLPILYLFKFLSDYYTQNYNSLEQCKESEWVNILKAISISV